MFNMLIYCQSLGNAPHIESIHNSYGVEKFVTPIEHIWAWTAECSKRNGGINNLLIACHGGYQNKVKDEFGGWGIKLGTGLNQANAGLTRQLAGNVRNIYLYVCGAGQESDRNKLDKGEDYSNYANNRLTCKLMAQHSKCNVYAPSGIQKFESSRFFNRFNFGAWEGKVEKFTPEGNIVNVTSVMHEFGKETGDE